MIMMYLGKRPAVLWLSLSALVTPLLPAASKFDLSRETPVPATEPVPIADFFRPSLLEQPRLNPSGTHIAAVVTAGEEQHRLLVYELKTQKLETIGVTGDRNIYSVRWLNDRRLIFQLSAEKMYGIGLMAAEVGALGEMYPLLQYYNSAVVAVPPADRLHPLVWNRYNSLERGGQPDLGVAMINTDIKSSKIVNLLSANADMQSVDYLRTENDRHILRTFPRPPGGNTLGYITDLAGQLDFCETAENGVPTLHRFADGRWQKCPVDLEQIDVIDCGDKHGQLVVLAPREPGKPRALRYLDGATGQLGDVLLQETAYDFFNGGLATGWLYRDPVKYHIIGAYFARVGPQVIWFNDGYLVLQKVLDGFFPGLVVHIIGSDEAQKFFLVATFSDRQPVMYQWVDLEKRVAGLFKRSVPWIDPARMQPMTPIKFKTRDGHRLDAYLTLPAGASKTNPPPLVVLPHGGPWVRDTWGFNGEVQFLASRGYAVLQPNYRGSNGYGWMFPESDAYDFAKMHDDVTDATKALLTTGLVDRNRIAIMGASFGGYLAASGVVNEPALYRCAVTIAGVFDWEQQIRDKKYDQYDSFVFGYLMRKLGDPKKDPARFDAISPGRHVDKIRVPVFVAGGKEDTTVEITQARALLSALDKYQVPHESYIVGEEGHGMAHLDKQVELYTRIEAFLAKNLAPLKPSASAASTP